MTEEESVREQLRSLKTAYEDQDWETVLSVATDVLENPSVASSLQSTTAADGGGNQSLNNSLQEIKLQALTQLGRWDDVLIERGGKGDEAVSSSVCEQDACYQHGVFHKVCTKPPHSPVGTTRIVHTPGTHTFYVEDPRG